MPVSNTRDLIRSLIGERIVGVLFDALPLNRADLQPGNKTLVFEDGTGFTFSSGGAFWGESADDIARAIKRVEGNLRDSQRDLEGVLELAGVLSPVSNGEES